MAEGLKRNSITSCTFVWYDCGLTNNDNILCVKTRIMHNEIQARYYNGYGMLGGRIWPLSKEQSGELFDLLEKSNSEWTSDDYSVFVCDGWSWQLKISTSGRGSRTIRGNVEFPPHGLEIHKMIAGIIGEENCYIFDPPIEEDEEDVCEENMQEEYPGIPKAEFDQTLAEFLENPYWRKYYETAPSEVCREYISMEFYNSEYQTEDAEEILTEMEEDLGLEDWEHLLAFCGNNPRKAYLTEKIESIRMLDPSLVKEQKSRNKLDPKR